jgi:hypothetical protein
MPETTWQELYKAAVLELDPQKANERVDAARRAVRQRLNGENGIITCEEYGRLDDALRILSLLTTASVSA